MAWSTGIPGSGINNCYCGDNGCETCHRNYRTSPNTIDVQQENSSNAQFQAMDDDEIVLSSSLVEQNDRLAEQNQQLIQLIKQNGSLMEMQQKRISMLEAS